MEKKLELIRLHNMDNNSEIIVNKNDIMIITTNEYSCSLVHIGTYCSIVPFNVNEKPSQIISPDDKEFITLHMADDNSLVIIRGSEISIVDSIVFSKGVKSKVYFSGSTELRPISVHESPEKIRQMLLNKIEII